MSLLVADQRIVRLRDDFFIRGHKDPLRYAIYCERGEQKYGEPFWLAEREKYRLRRGHAARPCPGSWDEARAQSLEFWQEYEEINRVLLPEDPVYTGVRLGATLSTTVDLWTGTVGASGQDRVLESLIGGEATASAVTRIGLNRPSSNGVTPTNQTPEKMNTRSPAAVGTFATTWTTQPTLSTNDVATQTFNAFGGVDRWVPQPGEELYRLNGEQLSCRSRSGTSVVSSHAVWEEL